MMSNVVMFRKLKVVMSSDLLSPEILSTRSASKGQQSMLHEVSRFFYSSSEIAIFFLCLFLVSCASNHLFFRSRHVSTGIHMLSFHFTSFCFYNTRTSIIITNSKPFPTQAHKIVPSSRNLNSSTLSKIIRRVT